MVSLTFYGGAGEIGGNKILLEDEDTRIFLDFGMSFASRGRFYEEFLSPRCCNALGDFLEMGLTPDIEGVYRDDLLKATGRKPVKPDIDAVFLSHAHADHANYISFLHEDIPIYCGESAHLILQAIQESSSRDIESEIIDFKRRPIIDRREAAIERTIKPFRTSDKIKIGALEVEPVHVDHSIPGAYGFVIHTSEGAIAYTGDFRMHGMHPDMTEEFLEKASEARPIALISEGTNIDKAEKAKTSEAKVRRECSETIASSQKMVIADFNFKDVDRLQTFLSIARENDRKLLLPAKNACLLKWYCEDRELKKVLPGVEDDSIAIYQPKRGTGRYDEKDYDVWERPYLKCKNVMSASEVQKKQKEVIMTLSFYGMNELIDIKPEPNSIYIHSLSEPFNEEMQIDYGRLQNWIEHFKLQMHQSHASGHAKSEELGEVIERINPQKVFPVHTEHPEMFREYAAKVIVPDAGRGYEV